MMKKFLKKNRLTIIVTIFLFAWVFMNLVDYANEVKRSRDIYNRIVEECTIDINYNGLCNEYLEEPYKKPDTITSFFYILCNYNLNLLQIIAPLFVIIPSMWNFHKKLKTGYIKNELTRQTYKKYMLKEIIGSMKCILILPCMLLFLFIGCYIISGHFDYTNFIAMLVMDKKFLSNLPLTMAVYFVNIVLHSIFYVNLGLIFCKKNGNILVSIIASYISFILLDLFFEAFVGSFLLGYLLKIHGFVSLFNLFGIWLYTDYSSLSSIFIFSLFLSIFSSILVFYTYRKKEEVVICSEA